MTAVISRPGARIVQPGMLDAINRAEGVQIEQWDNEVYLYADARDRHATPGRDCPACPAAREEHDGYGCLRTGCPMPIALLTRRPSWDS